MTAPGTDGRGADARSARHRLIGLGLSAIAATGADRWLGWVARGAGVVLAFHRVRPAEARAFAPNAALEVTPAFLDTAVGTLRALGFDIVPLDAVPARLRAPAARPFAALTFDDGYRDNLEEAWPVLKRHGAPWTLFVTSDFADGRGCLWWIELETAVARLDRVALPLDGGRLGGERSALPARTPGEKAAAFARASRLIRPLPAEAREAVLADLFRQAGLAPRWSTRELCADWTELAALARDPLVTLGAHTVSHPFLSACDAAQARSEIREARARIERRLGLDVHTLAYPYGSRAAADRREFALAAEAGYALAVTTRPAHVGRGHAGRLQALPRISVNGLFQSEPALRALLSGLPFALAAGR